MSRFYYTSHPQDCADSIREMYAEFTEREREQIFGGDIYHKYKCVEFLNNVVKQLGNKNITDREFWQGMAKWFTLTEVQELYNRVCSEAVRLKLEDKGYRGIPDLTDDDEPYEVFSWLYSCVNFRYKFLRVLAEMLNNRCQDFKARLDADGYEPTVFHKRVQELQTLLRLTDTEANLVLFLFFVSEEDIQLGSDLFPERYRHAYGKGLEGAAMALALSRAEVGALIKPSGNLCRFRLLSDNSELGLEESFRNWLAGSGDQALSERYYTKVSLDDPNVLNWEYYDEEMRGFGDKIAGLVDKNNNQSPLHFLLCGVPGSGKSSFAHSLAKYKGYELYKINASDDNDGGRYSANFRYGAIQVANEQLNMLGTKAILLIDESDAMLTNVGNFGGIFSLFKLKPDRSKETKSILTNLLDSVTVPCLWVGNSSPEHLDEATLRRFQDSRICRRLSVQASKNVWRNVLNRFEVSEMMSDVDIENLAKSWQELSPGGITNCVRGAKLQSNGDREAFMQNILYYVKNHAGLMGITPSSSSDKPNRNYSLDLVNTRSNMRMEVLVEAAKNYLDNGCLHTVDSPQFNILCTGPSGAGKSEFARYLAHELKRPIHIKNISDLMDKYVGETEKLIALAFKEAHEAGAVLVLDEVDALLTHRSSAQRSWEVSKTNTMLQCMDQYRGNYILICTTNIVKSLDPASLRRFTFKVRFDYLTPDQVLDAYDNAFAQFKLPELSEAQKKQLRELERLCLGDFKVVSNEFYFLQGSQALNHDELIAALKSENDGKMGARKSDDLVNELSRRIGF